MSHVGFRHMRIEKLEKGSLNRPSPGVRDYVQRRRRTAEHWSLRLVHAWDSLVQPTHLFQEDNVPLMAAQSRCIIHV